MAVMRVQAGAAGEHGGRKLRNGIQDGIVRVGQEWFNAGGLPIKEVRPDWVIADL